VTRMVRLILASASPRRHALLDQIGLDHRQIPSGLSEDVDIKDPKDQVVSLALAKAKDIARHYPDDCILGADTVVVFENEIMGKPKNDDEAQIMLATLSGKTHRVLTGIALVKDGGRSVLTACEETRVTFRSLDEKEIADYIASGEAWDKAGAYGIQGRAAVFVERIEGCYFNVVGLPLSRLIMLMKQW